jgi:uncharacterized phage protein (TIGR01671 family)
MREIKFRAWDREGIYYNQYNENSSRMIYGITLNNPKIHTRFDLFDLMQYTELKDKNGKEIYEKDIVKGNFDVEYMINDDEIKLVNEELIGEVSFQMGCFGIVFEGDNFLPLWSGSSLEVLGNVYENPELLEQI